MDWIHLAQDGDSGGLFCEHDTEQLGSIKMRGISRRADELLACHTSVPAVSYFDKIISRISSGKRCCTLRTRV